jgi:CBS domain-containing protein
MRRVVSSRGPQPPRSEPNGDGHRRSTASILADRVFPHRRFLERGAPLGTARLDGNAPIGEVMIEDVLCVTPELSVESLTALFFERGLTGAPVVNDDGRLVGFVSMSDLVRERFERADADERPPPGKLGFGFHADDVAHATVAQVMTPVAYALHPGEPLARAAALMSFEGVHQLPIVNEDDHVVGILSALDIMGWMARQHGYLLPPGSQAHPRH